MKNSRSVFGLTPLARADWSRTPLIVIRYRVDSTSPPTSSTSWVGIVPATTDRTVAPPSILKASPTAPEGTPTASLNSTTTLVKPRLNTRRTSGATVSGITVNATATDWVEPRALVRKAWNNAPLSAQRTGSRV